MYCYSFVAWLFFWPLAFQIGEWSYELPRGFKFGMNLLPSRSSDSANANNKLDSPEGSQIQARDREE